MDRIKKLYSLLLSVMIPILCLLSWLTLPTLAEEISNEIEPVCYEHGDVNGDDQVDSLDALYVLYHHFFEDNPEYAVTQDCDFDHDDSITAKDAIYVLYGASGGDLAQSHPLEGTIHQYYAPVWIWAEDCRSASLTLKCGCGKSQTLTASVENTNQTAATCLKAGSEEYKAEVTFQEKIYSDRKVLEIPATQHIMNEPDCVNPSSCSCGYTLEALGHKWILDESQSKEVTCTSPAVQVYKCENANCTETQSITLKGLAEHSYKMTLVQDQEVLCKFQEVLTCSNCGDTESGKVQYQHTYTASLTKEATCQQEGVKTFKCDYCDDSYTEDVAVTDAHKWDSGATTEGTNLTTFTCQNCDAQKIAVCTNEDNASVSKEDLEASTEVQISGVSVSLDDDIVENLESDSANIQIITTTVEALPVTTELKDQIGNNTVYDFTLIDGKSQISELGGIATISVPYELQDGDDVDCIDIWFITDEGKVTCVKGTYSNGYVTFTTDHFSYYTVTRLTPAQRCEAYGHAIGISHVDATCTKEGYHREICQRCGYEQVNKTLELIPHNYQETGTAATCTTDGTSVKTCSACSNTITGTIPALGHNYQKDHDQSAEATCKASGKDVYVCANAGCTDSYTVELPQLKHDYGDTQQSEADCGSQGHKKRVCKLCGYEDVIDTSAPTGHDYLAENAIWEWEEDYSKASVTLVCSYNPKHTKKLKTVVTSEVKGKTCQGTGEIVYTATGSFNKYTYTDVKTVALDKTSHQPEATWQNDATNHHRLCQNCGETLDAAEHTWGSQTVITAPTCTTSGEAAQNCTVCGRTRNITLEATGNHDFVNGICKDCQFAENTCGHIRTHKTPLDLSGYNVCDGTDIQWVSCDCGKVKYLFVESTFCNMEYTDRQETLLSGERVYINTSTCQDCGLVIEWRYYTQTDAETCYTTEVEEQKILIDGELIASGQRQYEGEGSGIHMGNIPGETVDLTQYGDLCGVTLKTWHCACGKNSYTSEAESTCRWNWDDEQSTDEIRVYECRICGAVRKYIEKGRSKEDCILTNGYEHIYEVDGQEIYRFTAQDFWYQHDYETVDALLDGDSCSDGVYVKEICRDCGKVHEYYVDYHIDAQRTETMLDGFCYDTLVQASCTCGERKNCYLESSGNSYCDFVHTGNTAVCETCGLTRIEETTIGDKDEHCRAPEITTYTYKDKDGKTVATGEEIYIETWHNYKTNAELIGKSCEDGVKVTKTCLDCGYVDRYTGRYHIQIQTRYDLSKHGLCGGELVTYTCPCGQDSDYYTSNSYCDWEYVSGDKNTDVYLCTSCQVTRTETTANPETLGTCVLRYPVTITYSKNGKNLLEVDCTESRDSHREVYTLTALDENCEEVRVNSTCLGCGKTSEWYHSGESHGTWAVSRKWLSQGTLCGDLELVTYSCACGQVTEQDVQWHNGECDFDKFAYLGDGKGEISTCTQCGVTKNRIGDSGKVQDSCLWENTEQVTFRKNGTTLFSYSTRDLHESHNYVSSFELFGTTCADGFEVSGTCFDCGKTRTYTLNDADCSYQFTSAMELLYDGDDICGPLVKKTYGCACGNDRGMTVSDNCRWEYPDEPYETDIAVCSQCGVQKTQNSDFTTDRNSCSRTYQCEYTYEKDGKQLLTTQFSYTTMSHEYVAEYELMGDSCEDGYYVTQTCARCGYVRDNKRFETGHSRYHTEYYDLQKLGLCGGEIWKYSCACGQESGCSYNWNDCDWYSTGEKDPDTGLNQYYCAKCKTYRIIGAVGAAEKNSCDWKGVFHAMLTRDGVNLLDLHEPVAKKQHRYVMEEAILHNETQGCEGGYRVTEQCLYCDATSISSGYDHNFYIVEYLELKELYSNACGGYATLETCACGEYSQLYNYEKACSQFTAPSEMVEGTNGYTHTIETRMCKDCELVWTEDSYLEPVPNSCYSFRHSTTTLSVHGQTLDTWTTGRREAEHTVEVTYSLMPGSSDCEDGLRVTETCRFCDYENVWNYAENDYNHNYYNADATTSIDLADYGSVCGGKLIHYTCACGKQERYDFSPDTLCDIDRYSIGHFVPGTIDTAQYTTEGYVWTDSNSYTMTCAVTDPDCDLKIRMSEYWLEKNCVAIEYQTWQLGYDDLNGTCQYEFTIETGERHAYHPYKHSNSTTYTDDGQQVNINSQICPQCGSSYIEKDYFNASGSRVKDEEIAVNTLNNGENKQFTKVYTYDLLHAGYRYETLYRYDVTHADGSTFWEKNEYTYDFTNGCVRIRTYTNSDGYRKVVREDAHISSWESKTLKNATCSQYGQYQEIYSCKVCKQIYHTYNYDITPTAHNWKWNAQKQFYECSVCGLENINGASGEIVLEDMTDSHGKNVNYVVGYWNRGGVDALRYVSVVLKDAAEGENEELVLTEIPFTYLTEKKDGITAVVFSKEVVRTAAEAAVEDAGYTGSYVIRFTFVPRTAADTLDYAITFDNLDA